MINSTMLMQGLLVIYVVVAILSGWEGNYPRCLYWISAAGITSAVLWGMR